MTKNIKDNITKFLNENDNVEKEKAIEKLIKKFELKKDIAEKNLY